MWLNYQPHQWSCELIISPFGDHVTSGKWCPSSEWPSAGDSSLSGTGTRFCCYLQWLVSWRSKVKGSRSLRLRSWDGGVGHMSCRVLCWNVTIGLWGVSWSNVYPNSCHVTWSNVDLWVVGWSDLWSNGNHWCYGVCPVEMFVCRSMWQR